METKLFEAALAPGRNWMDAYGTIEAQARVVLDAMKPEDERITTAMLADRLYDGEDDHTWDRIFKGLRALEAHGLKNYAVKGEPEKIGNIMGRRTYWGPASKVCPTCHKPI